MKNKTWPISDLIMDPDRYLDILVVTESWLHGDLRDDTVFADISSTFPYYRFSHSPRETRGGGICVIYRSALKVSVNESTKFKSFELLDLSVTYDSSVLRLF